MLWLHGLECTCCTEAFIRSAHPLAKDVILSMISLDYDDTIMAAAGHQAEAALEQTMTKYKGKYILAVEGNPPLGEDGMYLHPRRQALPREAQARRQGRQGDHRLGLVRLAGAACRPPSRTRRTATPINKVITDKPIIKVPGCPPIAEVMTGVVTYMLTFDRIPELDRQGRPKMFYSQRIHDKCYRRPHFDAGQFVETWDDEGAQEGLLPLQDGLQGPDDLQRLLDDALERRHQRSRSARVTAASAAREDGFWDKGSFYDRLTTIREFGVEANADKVGLVAAGVVGAGLVAHAAVTAIRRATDRNKTEADSSNAWSTDHGRHRNPRLQARQQRQAHRRRPDHAHRGPPAHRGRRRRTAT